jgi:hypothetical protein
MARTITITDNLNSIQIIRTNTDPIPVTTTSNISKSEIKDIHLLTSSDHTIMPDMVVINISEYRVIELDWNLVISPTVTSAANLDAILTAMWATTPSSVTVTPVIGVHASGLLAVIPIGYMLELVIAQETGGANVDIKLGTAAGLDDIAPTQTMTASVCTSILLDRPPQGTAYNVFITSAAWTTASLNVYLVTRKIF